MTDASGFIAYVLPLVSVVRIASTAGYDGLAPLLDDVVRDLARTPLPSGRRGRAPRPLKVSNARGASSRSVRGRASVATSLLLIAAALADMPAVYVLVARARTPPALSLGFGFLSMGLAWAAGFELEGRRAWFVKLAAALGALQVVAAFAPIGLPLAPLVASGALAGSAFVIASLSRNDQGAAPA